MFSHFPNFQKQDKRFNTLRAVYLMFQWIGISEMSFENTHLTTLSITLAPHTFTDEQ